MHLIVRMLSSGEFTRMVSSSERLRLALRQDDRAVWLLVTRVGRIGPSVWDKEKSFAFADLNLTADQWKLVYRSIWSKCHTIMLAVAKESQSARDDLRSGSGSDAMAASWP